MLEKQCIFLTNVCLLTALDHKYQSVIIVNTRKRRTYQYYACILEKHGRNGTCIIRLIHSGRIVYTYQYYIITKYRLGLLSVSGRKNGYVITLGGVFLCDELLFVFLWSDTLILKRDVFLFPCLFVWRIWVVQIWGNEVGIRYHIIIIISAVHFS